MKCVEQTRLYEPEGNCYAACIASILECDLDEVPQHTAEEGVDFESWTPYWRRLEAWMARWNLRPQIIDAIPGWRPAGYTILGGTTYSGCPHAVVCLDGKIVWNPFPEGADIEDISEWTIFTVLDPSRPIGPLKEQP